MMDETEVLGEVFPKGVSFAPLTSTSKLCLDDLTDSSPLPQTILSVPSYSIHYLPEFWGKDAAEFRPERWLESEEKTRQLEKQLNVFSYGPRSCVGRNVA